MKSAIPSFACVLLLSGVVNCWSGDEIRSRGKTVYPDEYERVLRDIDANTIFILDVFQAKRERILIEDMEARQRVEKWLNENHPAGPLYANEIGARLPPMRLICARTALTHAELKDILPLWGPDHRSGRITGFSTEKLEELRRIFKEFGVPYQTPVLNMKSIHAEPAHAAEPSQSSGR